MGQITLAQHGDGSLNRCGGRVVRRSQKFAPGGYFLLRLAQRGLPVKHRAHRVLLHLLG